MTLKLVAFIIGVLFCKSSAAASTRLVVTASSIESLRHDLSSIRPPIRNVGGLNPKIYTKEMSCLGYYGSLGPFGPLGIMGPLGNNIWNPSFWISAIGDWNKWTNKHHGPLSSEGPLGQKGPLSLTAYWKDLPAINDFGKQLQAGGVWAVLGPCGPLGALGPLGPLGPVGGHGYGTDRNGQYVSGGKGVRTIDVDWDGKKNMRTYSLYENYDETFAKNMKDNDASFMVHGRLRDKRSTSTFSFTSPEDQFVTVVVMPEYASMFYYQAMTVLGTSAIFNYESMFAPSAYYTFDDFDITISDSVTGRILTSSLSKTLVDFVTIQVPAEKKLQVKISLKSSWHYSDKFYRLFVTGSTKYINTTDITGKHQLSWGY